MRGHATRAATRRVKRRGAMLAAVRLRVLSLQHPPRDRRRPPLPPGADRLDPRLLQPRRRDAAGGGRRAPRARASSTSARELARALGYEHYAIGHNVHPAQGPLRERHPQPLADPARAEHRPDGRLPAAARLPAHAHRGEDARAAGRGGSRSSTSTSASPPASGSGRSPCSPARASSQRCPSACRRSWPATTTTGARCCGPSSWTCSASAPPPAATPSASARSPPSRPSSRRARSTASTTAARCASPRARRCRLALSRVASDHLPVIVDFDL